jgi:hypothetical protein
VAAPKVSRSGIKHLDHYQGCGAEERASAVHCLRAATQSGLGHHPLAKPLFSGEAERQPAYQCTIALHFDPFAPNCGIRAKISWRALENDAAVTHDIDAFGDIERDR